MFDKLRSLTKATINECHIVGGGMGRTERGEEEGAGKRSAACEAGLRYRTAADTYQHGESSNLHTCTHLWLLHGVNELASGRFTHSRAVATTEVFMSQGCSVINL